MKLLGLMNGERGAALSCLAAPALLLLVRLLFFVKTILIHFEIIHPVVTDMLKLLFSD